MMKTLKISILVFLVLAAPAIHAPSAHATLTVKANHDHLQVDFNYHGGSVSLSGKSDPSVDLVFKIASPDGHEKLMKKDHVGGVIWMNTEEVRFEHVPGVYFLKSTRPLEEILSEPERNANAIGYDAIAAVAEITPAPGPKERAALFEEFIKYKESKRLFSRSSGDVAVTPGDAGQSYRTMLEWPYQAPPGRYLVSAYAVKDGKVVEQAETEVLVEQAGVVKTLAEMAGKRGGLYGVVAIMVALVAGFGVGMVFRKSGGAH